MYSCQLTSKHCKWSKYSVATREFVLSGIDTTNIWCQHFHNRSWSAIAYCILYLLTENIKYNLKNQNEICSFNYTLVAIWCVVIYATICVLSSTNANCKMCALLVLNGSMSSTGNSLTYIYYTSPEICLYKSNTIDWYVIPRDKVKNITYGYANERVGLISHVQFVWIKSLRHINYAVAHAQCVWQQV